MLELWNKGKILKKSEVVKTQISFWFEVWKIKWREKIQKAKKFSRWIRLNQFKSEFVNKFVLRFNFSSFKTPLQRTWVFLLFSFQMWKTHEGSEWLCSIEQSLSSWEAFLRFYSTFSKSLLELFNPLPNVSEKELKIAELKP